MRAVRLWGPPAAKVNDQGMRSSHAAQDTLNEQSPLPWGVAIWAEARCVVATVLLLARRLVHLRAEHLGMLLSFADGTSAHVYRETVVDRGPTRQPCVLVVEFRLRAVRGRGHVWFRRESLLNTPLFVGFPGFVSKLWMAHDQGGVYRGLYEWDGPELAEHYARTLWRVLALACVRGSIHYRVVPGMDRDRLLGEPEMLNGAAPEEPAAWWRLVETR